MIRKLTRTLALTAAAGAVAAPAATAMPAGPDPGPASSAPTALPPQIVKSAAPAGFDFGDAAIGAGAVLTVLLAGAGGTLVARRARRPQFSPAQRA